MSHTNIMILKCHIQISWYWNVTYKYHDNSVISFISVIPNWIWIKQQKKITIKQCTNKDIRKSLCWMCRICPLIVREMVLMSRMEVLIRKKSCVWNIYRLSNWSLRLSIWPVTERNKNLILKCYWTYTTHSTKGLSYILISSLFYRYFFAVSFRI